MSNVTKGEITVEISKSLEEAIKVGFKIWELQPQLNPLAPKHKTAAECIENEIKRFLHREIEIIMGGAYNVDMGLRPGKCQDVIQRLATRIGVAK